jgi:glycerophosphoryl diester phosphodiesterase
MNPEQYVVSSFLPDVLRRMSEIDSKIPLGYISRRLDALQIWTSLPVKYVIPRHDLVSHELIAAVHNAGCKLLTWTVNRPKEMLALAEWGVDGIISDDPALLSKTLRPSR